MTIRKSNVVFLAIVLLIGCITLGVWTANRRHQPRVWDFSKSHTLRQVPWPANKVPDDPFLRIETHRRVIMHFPHGMTFDRYVEQVYFTAAPDQVHIRHIQLDGEAQSADDAYAAACRLADDWGMPKEQLAEWHERARTGAAVYGPYRPVIVEINKNDRPVPVSLGVLYTFRKDKPFWICFSVNWPKP